MAHPRHSGENALTGLEVIMIVIILIVMGHILISALSVGPTSGGSSPGIVRTYTGESGYAIEHTGPVTVFSAVSGRPSDVTIQFPHPDPTRLGAVEMTVALFMGDMGGVDFDRVDLSWTTGSVVEKIPRKDTRPLTCPGWTIADRFDVPAGTAAPSVKLPKSIPRIKGGPGSAPNLSATTGNEILYPGEQFEVLVCPTNTTPPYQQFTITINAPGNEQPPVATLSAPVMDKPVITLNQV